MPEWLVAAGTNLWNKLPEWFVAVGTIGLAFIAAYQDTIRAVLYGPKLDCKMELKPPDCHRTTMRVPTTTFYTYYYLFEIWNKGKTSAKNVEVIISDVFKKEGNYFKPIEDFFPDNLKWSLISDVRGVDAQGKLVTVPKIYCDYISPKTFKLCNLGHIYDPNNRGTASGEDNPTLPIKNGETIFCFDVNFRSNKLNYLVQPGTYKFTITVGCENAKTITKKFIMEVTGKWHEDESRMLNEGLKISEARSA